jgi:hypothetical protein
MSINQEEPDRRQELEAWLKDNVLIIPEPKAVTLYCFDVDWSDWSGEFRVKFDDFELDDSLSLRMEITGRPIFQFPIFTSPLGVPASFSSINITSNTEQAINEALRRTFPRLKPLGRNRGTGIEITSVSPIDARLSRREIEEAKLLVIEGYSVSVWIENL